MNVSELWGDEASDKVVLLLTQRIHYISFNKAVEPITLCSIASP